MQALVAFAILLLLMGVAYLILRPFLIREEIEEEEATDPELVSQKNRVIDAIREIDMDYQTGKLSDEDYQLLRARYTAAAAEILRRLDEQDAAAIPAPAERVTASVDLGRSEDDAEAGTAFDGDGDGEEVDRDAELERLIAARRKELQLERERRDQPETAR